MTDKQAKSETTVAGMPVSKLVTSGGGGVVLLLIAWQLSGMADKVDKLSETVADVTTTITKVTTALEINNPKQVRDDLAALRQVIVTKGDLSTLAPWSQDRPVWEAWKSDVNKRLSALESK